MNREFHPEAELELVESALHYEEQVTGLGTRFADEVQRVIEWVRKVRRWAVVRMRPPRT